MDFLTDLLRDLQERLKRAYDNTPLGIVVALLACVAGVFAVLYFFPYSEGYGALRKPLFTMWNELISYSEDDWKHCRLVPLIALGVALWQLSLAPLRKASGGALWALAGVLFCLLLFFVGYRIAQHYVGFFALIGLLIFSIAFTAGLEVTLRLAFPLVFLVFAVPTPFLDTIITFPLRMIMANASVFALNVFGADVIRVGTGLLSAPVPELGIAAGERFSVDVADPCSGIRSLYALMMVAALYGHFALKALWKKGVLFLTAIPLAVLGNLVRIIILTFGTIAFGSEFAIGKHALTDPSWFHMGAGYVVFLVALSGMFLVATILRGEAGIYWRKLSTALAMPPDVQPPKGERNDPLQKTNSSQDERDDIY